MKPALLLPFALASLGLAGLAVYALLTHEPARPRLRLAAPSAAPAPAPTTDEPPLVRFARAAGEPTPTLDAPAAPADDGLIEEEAVVRPLELPSRSAASATFEALIGELEAIDEPDELSRGRREQLYNGVNGAFEALSAQLGPDEREELEDAYQRMRANLGRLKIERPREAEPEEVYVAH